ncbi:THO complex subunit 4D [Abeliophyllum distichum]|uniref:THO complex subunit 4D n=1 Tax=Abeliophyllum distichum TaxID=126358 RepID=A0ABD1V1U2_9LAMI
MATLDISLDDMIKNRRNSDRGRGLGRPRRGRGPAWSFRGGRNSGTQLRGPLSLNARPSVYNIAKSVRRTKNFPWQNGLFEDGLKAAGLSGLENGTKLFVSNLDIGVTNQDIRELFSEIGELIRYAIHYDKNGRPSGSAEVVFARRSDAFQALKRYNNVQLDGKPMKIEIIGVNAEIPISARMNVIGRANGKRTVVTAPRLGRSKGSSIASNRNFVQRSRGGSFSGRRGGRTRPRPWSWWSSLDKENS